MTVPVNIDQNARRIMAANAQNLYRPFLNKLESRVSFFNADDDDDDTGKGSSSLILTKRMKLKSN